MRVMLYEAAQSMLRSKKWSWLKAWAMQVARRCGMKKAIVALARRLAVIMHRIWTDGTEFCWTREAAAVSTLRSNKVGGNPSSTKRWYGVPRGTTDEVSSHVCLDLPTARPSQRSFHLVLESHDGRALAPIPKRSTSPRVTSTPQSWIV